MMVNLSQLFWALHSDNPSKTVSSRKYALLIGTQFAVYVMESEKSQVQRVLIVTAVRQQVSKRILCFKQTRSVTHVKGLALLCRSSVSLVRDKAFCRRCVRFKWRFHDSVKTKKWSRSSTKVIRRCTNIKVERMAIWFWRFLLNLRQKNGGKETEFFRYTRWHLQKHLASQ